MKKFLCLMACIFLLTGCSFLDGFFNKPTSELIRYLNNYLERNVSLDNSLTTDDELTDEEREEYKAFLKTHYQSLSYEIGKEKINGDQAVVPVIISVKNYAPAINSANVYYLNHFDEFDSNNTFAMYKLNKMKEVTDKTKYTISFTLKKVNGKWEVQDLSDNDQKRIDGLYGANELDKSKINNTGITGYENSSTGSADDGTAKDQSDLEKEYRRKNPHLTAS